VGRMSAYATWYGPASILTWYAPLVGGDVSRRGV
jgi:hypothetical protein